MEAADIAAGIKTEMGKIDRRPGPRPDNCPVEFLRHFHDMSFPEAVRFLLKFNGYPVGSPDLPPLRKTRPPPQRERPVFILPPANGDNERVRAYLIGRGIAPGVVDDFINTGLLYGTSSHETDTASRTLTAVSRRRPKLHGSLTSASAPAKLDVRESFNVNTR